MCVYSMIMDHYYDKWEWPKPQPEIKPTLPKYYPPIPTQEEIDEFKKLLERAREYDKKHSEPECELKEKKQKLLDLAKELGIEDKLKILE